MVMVGTWRARNGIQTYTVNGSKEELQKIIEEITKNGGSFAESPNISHVHKGQYHVLLKLKLPVGVGASDQINDPNV
jgi:hypothetical protein